MLGCLVLVTAGCPGGDDGSGSGADAGSGASDDSSAVTHGADDAPHDGGTDAGDDDASTDDADTGDTGHGDTDTDSTTTGVTATAGDTNTDTSTATDTSGDTDASTGTDTGTGGSESTGGDPPSDDPFDPTACTGTPWTASDAFDALGGLPREVLDSATIQVHTRTCPGGVCGQWSDNSDWTITYLTYSGGVTTAYKDFLAAMDFVLFDDDGTARLSMQHITFPSGGYPDTDGVVYDFPPSTVSYPHLRAYDVAPDSPNYYTDLDYQVSEGELVLGDGCAVWAAYPFGAGLPHTAQYGVVFRW